MERKSENKRVILCSSCDACPEIVFEGEGVLIGEEGNRVRLKKQEWNDLVQKIRKGELGTV